MRKQAGFTLIELIVVMVVLGLIAASGGMILTRAFTSANKFNATNDPNYWQGTIAYERMVRDLREMATLVTAGSTSITYVNNAGNTVTYSLSGSSQLLRSVAPTAPASGTVLSTAITRLAFTYYDVSGLSTNSGSNVACINITTTLTQPTQTGSTLRTLVCPRNFMP
jgi:prepilin-type N-terminal cleavage/methylation domain-containing protein